MNPFKKLKAFLKLNEAIKQADEAFARTGFRHYILPLQTKKKELLIVDKKNFKKMKQKGYIDKSITITDVRKYCFYCTSFTNGIDKLSGPELRVKRKNYFKWYFE